MPGIMDAIRLIYREEAIEEGLKKGLKKGLAQGIHLGEHKKAVETARQMLAEKEPLDKIVRYTQLSVEEIQGL